MSTTLPDGRKIHAIDLSESSTAKEVIARRAAARGTK